jgi:class I lanthipeptide synthase
VDVQLDGQVIIPEVVLKEAAAAADVLLRLTTRPFGFPSWMEYQARFNERYGQGALVPVRELVSDSGLGYPDGFLGAPPVRPVWRTLTERDAALLALIQEAVLSGRDEIRLTRADIAALTVGDPSAVVPPHRAEIAVAVQAASAEAVTTGAFELMVTGVARYPGSMAGRFAHLLADAERDRLADTFWPAGPDENTMAVQVSFPPRVTRNEHMTRAEPLTGAVVHIGEYPQAGGAEMISVDDLAVTADAAQLYLVHVPTGRRVVPHVPHALEMTAHTPRLARFIAEVADARCAELRPLDVGAARVLPYVPRIRHRKTILSSARWFLDSSVITRDPMASRDWQLATWRKQWRVPARIVLCQAGERLPLDLDRVLDRQMLYQRLDREPRAELREDAAADAGGWLGKPAEVLIPLTLAEPPSRPLPVTARAGAMHHPGAGDVVCAQIIGNPVGFDTIITSRFPALARRLDGTVVRWWVRRFRNMIHPEIPQHVAIYLRLADQSGFGQATGELGEFAAGLERDGLPGRLTIAPYSEHPGRYGEGPALAAAEDVWAADTQAAVAQLAIAARGDVPNQALAAASMAQLAAGFAIDPAAGYRALTVSLDQGSGPLDRMLRDLACDIADPAGGFAALCALPGGEAVAEAWRRRDAALSAYHDCLADQRNPETVLRTLLHEHHMRAVGLDPAFEKQTGRLARSAALRLLALAGLL